MFRDKILDGTNSRRVQHEAQAWIKVLDELESVVPEIDCSQQHSATRLIVEARGTLCQCTSKNLSPHSPSIKRAQELVESVLALFPEHIDLVESVFFSTLAVGGLEFIMSELEEMTPEKVSDPRAKRLLRDLDSSLGRLVRKLNRLENQFKQENTEFESGGAEEGPNSSS